MTSRFAQRTALWIGISLSGLVGRGGRSGSAEIADTAVDAPNRWQTLWLAVCLSMGSAIALGLARFAYALLLPAMKSDLGWSFAQAGAMNTANALGYLLGALAFPKLSRRWSAGGLFVFGCIATALLMAATGMLSDSSALFVQRVATGVASAFIFVSGGVLAARLASSRPRDAGLILGLYYGGTGWGIVASAVLVPLTLVAAAHGWQHAWFALAAACAILSIVAGYAARRIEDGHATPSAPGGRASTHQNGTSWTRYALMLAGYGLFGIGYIGYMTFVIALLRNGGMTANVITSFYVLLGVATIVSARVWAGLLNRMRGGQALAALNGLLAFATLLPALIVQPAIALLSGALFGATFLSAVASTTAFVRHNLPPEQWARGISGFTIVFASGQIVGPTIIGWVSDGSGLERGLIWSAGLLATGAMLAVFQTSLQRETARHP